MLITIGRVLMWSWIMKNTGKKSLSFKTILITLFLLIFSNNSNANLCKIGIPIKQWITAGITKDPCGKIISKALSKGLVNSYISMTALYGIATNIDAFSLAHIESLGIEKQKLREIIEDFQFSDNEMMVFFVAEGDIFGGEDERYYNYAHLVSAIRSWFSAFKNDVDKKDISEDTLKLYLLQLDIFASVMNHMTFRNHKTTCTDVDSVRFRLMSMYTDVLAKVIKSTSSAYRGVLREKIRTLDFFNDPFMMEMYQNIADFFALWQFELVNSWYAMAENKVRENFISAALASALNLNYLLYEFGLLAEDAYKEFLLEYETFSRNIELWYRKVFLYLAENGLTLGKNRIRHYGATLLELSDSKIPDSPRKF